MIHLKDKQVERPTLQGAFIRLISPIFGRDTLQIVLPS
jgi:hypothetical protein